MSQKPAKIVIFGDSQRKHVFDKVNEFADFAEKKAEIIGRYCITECSEQTLSNADFAVVFGGDGSIIAAARKLNRKNVPIIGVNLGKLGFLAEFSENEIKQLLDDIIAEKTGIEKRMMLGCTLFSGGREKYNSAAINDVFITAGPPYRAIELRIYVDGQPLAGCLSDGLIIATPTGSTAYNLSAGGPILSGSLEAIVITPICPHSLSFRPVVINSNCVIEVRGESLNEGTTISIDGQVSWRFSVEDTVRIEKNRGRFLVVNNPMRSQWDTLATKLNWAGTPRYNRKGSRQ